MEKAVRREENGDPVAAPDDVQRPYVAHGILRPSGSRTEGAEVAAPTQGDEGPAHRRDAEGPGHMPRVAREERVRDRGVVDEVGVALAERRAARVEPARGLPNLAHADVVGQRGVERPEDHPRGEPGAHGQRGDLAEGVDAGVGATRADHLRVRYEPSRGVENDALDGAGAGLDLPAVVVGAVVRQHQEERGRGSYRGGERRRGARVGTRVSQTTATRMTSRVFTTMSHERPASLSGRPFWRSHSWRSRSFGS